MTTLFMVIVAIIAAVLTVWWVVIPAGMLVGTFKALGHGHDGKGLIRH